MFVLCRVSHTADATYGVLSQDGIPLCVTVERPWLDNRPDVSCIPPGIYQCSRYISPTKGVVWMVENVLGRSEIEIHAANTADELLGCIAVGQYFGMFGDRAGVANSQWTLNHLRDIIPGEFELRIISVE